MKKLKKRAFRTLVCSLGYNLPPLKDLDYFSTSASERLFCSSFCFEYSVVLDYGLSFNSLIISVKEFDENHFTFIRKMYVYISDGDNFILQDHLFSVSSYAWNDDIGEYERVL